MKRTLVVVALALCAACIEVPPIVIAPGGPPPAVPAPPAPAPVPLATIAFQFVDEESDAPIPEAFATCEGSEAKQANADGYAAIERAQGTFTCSFEASDYQSSTRKYQLTENRQFTVRLKSTKPKPPEPAPPVVLPTPPVVVPPAPVPPVVEPSKPALCSMRDSDPFGCVRQVAAVYPQLLLTNTYESCLEFTQRVLEVLGPDYGHVAKTAGESQSVPRGFTPVVVNGFLITGVSHDAIKHRVTGQVIDLLGNASANSDPNPKIHGPAQIQWAKVPPEHWRENNPYLPAVPVR